jgi:hypothetical protein
MTVKYIDTVTHFLVAKTQQTEGHLLHEKKAQKVLKILIFLNGTLIATASKSKGSLG